MSTSLLRVVERAQQDAEQGPEAIQSNGLRRVSAPPTPTGRGPARSAHETLGRTLQLLRSERQPSKFGPSGSRHATGLAKMAAPSQPAHASHVGAVQPIVGTLPASPAAGCRADMGGVATRHISGGAGWWKSPCPVLVRASGEQSPGATRPPDERRERRTRRAIGGFAWEVLLSWLCRQVARHDSTGAGNYLAGRRKITPQVAVRAPELRDVHRDDEACFAWESMRNDEPRREPRRGVEQEQRRTRRRHGDTSPPCMRQNPHTVTSDCNRVTAHRLVILLTAMSGPEPSARATADPRTVRLALEVVERTAGPPAALPDPESVWNRHPHGPTETMRSASQGASKSVGSNGETIVRLNGGRALEAVVWTFNRRGRLL